MLSKESILKEIKRISKNLDKPVGSQFFEKETGIGKHSWYPKYWLRWGDALKEAGLKANEFQKAYENEFLYNKYLLLVKELGRIPVEGELRLKCKSDKSFPSHNTWRRFGSKEQLIQQLIDYCNHSNEGVDTLDILEKYASKISPKNLSEENINNKLDGYVYLIKSGNYYKIGMTQDLHRRSREISIELPERSETIHVITTDDPSGIEAYWHRRFSEKRTNGEWFKLSGSDVKIFKRRKFM